MFERRLNTHQQGIPGAASVGTRGTALWPVFSHGSSRREFLRDGVRYPLLAGLALLGGWLALRKTDPSVTEPCLKQRVCRGCGLWDDCALPQARATRNHF